MSEKIKITFPEPIEGQTGWQIYHSIPVAVDTPDTRSIADKLAYRFLMWLHDKAESVWHWAYYTSRRFEKPQNFGTVHVPVSYHEVESE